MKEEQQSQPAEKVQVKKRKEVREGLRGIVRIAGKDVTGEVPLLKALMRVTGIGHSVSKAISAVIVKELNMPPSILSGELTDEQIEKIDGILLNVHNYLPPFMLNRRADPITGQNKHVITNDLIFAVRQDVEKEKKIYTWKGFRHAYGQKVRGQHTKNTGRGGAAMGVVRKSLQPGQTAPAAGAKTAAAPAAKATSPAKAATQKKEAKK